MQGLTGAWIKSTNKETAKSWNRSWLKGTSIYKEITDEFEGINIESSIGFIRGKRSKTDT